MPIQEALKWFDRKYRERISRYTVSDARTEAYLIAAKCISYYLNHYSNDSDDEYYEGANE